MTNREKPNAILEHFSSFSQLLGMKALSWHQVLTKEEHQEYFSFHLSEDWMNRETIIHFGTVQGAFYFSINGTKVGLCDEVGSTDYNISKFVNFNQENILMIEPINPPLFGKVILKSIPRLRVRDYYATCRLDDIYEDAYFKLDLEVQNDLLEDQAVQIEVFLSEKIKSLEQAYLSNCKLVAKKDMTTKVTIEERVKNPKKWTAETPHLYYGAIVLKQPTGQIISINKFELGFRSIEIDDAKLLINGKPLFLKGINGNHFSLNAVSSQEQYERIFYHLKRFNINAVKLEASKHPYFCQLCDRHGIYIVDELHHIELVDDDLINNMTHLIVKDRNHPSVIIWSFGNHEAQGERFIELKKHALLIDSMRPFHYEGDLELIISDFLSKKDVPLKYVDEISHEHDKYRKPALLSEFGTLEGHTQSIRHYINRFELYDNWCGIFVLGQEIQKILENKGDALMIKNVFQSVEIKEVALFENKISILNKNSFAPLDDYYIKWQLLEDGEVLKKGTLSGIKIEPMQLEEFVLPIGVYQQLEAAEYHLNVQVCLSQGDYSFEEEEVIGWTQFKMPYEVIIKAKKMIQKSLNVFDKRIKVEILGEDFSIRISKLTGDITSLVFENKEYLLAPLKLTLDQPKRTILGKIFGKKNELDYKVQDVSIENLKTEVIIKILRKVKNVKNHMITEYTIDGNGNLYVEHQLTPKKNLNKFGTSMAISNEFNKISWFGKGIGEDVIEKQTGEKIGVYSCNINEYLQYFSEQQEQSKNEIRWFSATTEDGEGLFFEDVDKTLLNMRALPCASISSKNERSTRLKDMILLNIDYNEKGFEEVYQTNQRKEQLQKNVEYQYRYKICRAF